MLGNHLHLITEASDKRALSTRHPGLRGARRAALEFGTDAQRQAVRASLSRAVPEDAARGTQRAPLRAAQPQAPRGRAAVLEARGSIRSRARRGSTAGRSGFAPTSRGSASCSRSTRPTAKADGLAADRRLETSRPAEVRRAAGLTDDGLRRSRCPVPEARCRPQRRLRVAVQIARRDTNAASVARFRGR